MQKTAVEYYADKQLELHQMLKDNQLSMIDFVVQSRDLLIEANEKFKQQIIDAYKSYYDGKILEYNKYAKGEKYYSETYKSK